MKSTINILLAFLGFLCHAHAGQSFLYPMIGPTQIPCCGPANYSIDVKNVNPTFAIQNINGTFVVTRQSNVIYEETIIPRQANLDPNKTTTFYLVIPIELLLLDGLLEVYFEFGSDFDLNPDPTQSNIAEVLGCGMTRSAVTDFFLAGYFASAEEQEAYIFLYKELLKPGTVIHGTNRDTYSTAVGAFSWLALIYDPLKRFEQPMQLVIANANTGETEVIDANWPPAISDETYAPDINSEDRISGDDHPDPAPSASFAFNPVASIPADSVCAIIVAGADDNDPEMQQSFDNDIKLMRDYFGTHPYGPRLPASNILIRQVKNGYSRDSLLMDLQNLKDKYKKVHFYYTGHALSFDGFVLGPDPETDLLTGQDFANELLQSGAETYCILIDACYSAKFIEAVCNHPEAQNVDIEMVSSASRLKPSRLEIWNINGMNQHFGMYTSHFFFAIQDPSTDKNQDGVVGLIEAYNRVTMVNLNDIVNTQLPRYKDMKSRTLKLVGEKIKAEALALYGPQVESATISVVPTVQPAGTVIESFDQSVTTTTTSPGYVAMIDMEPNALFSKPVTNATATETTLDLDFKDIPNTWPTIPACPVNPWEPAFLYQMGIDFRTFQPFSSIHQEIQTPGPPSDKTKTIIIPGWHPDPIAQNALMQSAQNFKENLTKEVFGHQLHDDNISFQPFISVTTLETYLASLQGIDNMIFYYTGNMMENGDIMLGTSPDEWMNMSSLFTHLANIGAHTYQLFFDASHAGIALNILKQNNPFEGKHLDLFTGANAINNAYFDVWVDDQMNMTGAQTYMTYNFLQLYGNPDYDSDSDGSVSMKESFNALFIQNPIAHHNTPLFVLSQPVNYSTRSISIDATSPGTYGFTGLDLSVRFEYRNQVFSVSAAQELLTADQTTAAADVYAISPSRRWRLSGLWEVDPSLRADLIFNYSEDIDVTSSSEGIPGLVSRLSPNDEWEAYYPVEYDAVEKTITAINVTEPREWAIARVQEIVGQEDPLDGMASFALYPNPANDAINISMMLDQPLDLAIRIMDFMGQIHYERGQQPFTKGSHHTPVRVEGLARGIYILEIKSPNGSTSTPFVVK